jgi:hypothetical protein
VRSVPAVSRPDPETGCGCLVLLAGASLVAIVGLAFVDVRLALLWLVVGAIGVVLLDTLAARPPEW